MKRLGGSVCQCVAESGTNDAQGTRILKCTVTALSKSNGGVTDVSDVNLIVLCSVDDVDGDYVEQAVDMSVNSVSTNAQTISSMESFFSVSADTATSCLALQVISDLTISAACDMYLMKLLS